MVGPVTPLASLPGCRDYSRAGSAWRHHASPAWQVARLLCARQFHRLIQCLAEIFLQNGRRDAAAEKIGPQEFAEWRHVLGIPPGAAQFAGQAAVGIVLQAAQMVG